MFLAVDKKPAAHILPLPHPPIQHRAAPSPWEEPLAESVSLARPTCLANDIGYAPTLHLELHMRCPSQR
ncbi:hypothetical protein F1880_003558 [Penicillium rolfsii]|nr:hypothetical protein F1880_003558 [Penicillium rolfsii]